MNTRRLAAIVLSSTCLLPVAGASQASGHRHGYPGHHVPGLGLRGPQVIYNATVIQTGGRGWQSGVYSGWNSGWNVGLHSGTHSAWHGGWRTGYYGRGGYYPSGAYYAPGFAPHRSNLAGAFALGVIGGGLAGAALAAPPVVSYPPTVVYPPAVVYNPPHVVNPPLVLNPPLAVNPPLVLNPPLAVNPPLVVGAGSAVLAAPPLPSTLPAPALAAAPLPIPSAPVPAPMAPGEPAFGTVYSALPPGCVFEPVNNQPYYRCGSYWYQAQFGPQGPQYVFVAPPRSY